ncbi:WD domain, G-beta repeat protein [Medicago truncatula]|uniref:WD domain, G-beta repeat protein n=2 Tax=Medicago truncatula TaxID=3880 RepID=A0A072UYV5_MEDTR|nr:WD domain, G-beta repeat protein [Medicago truncatula]
MDTKNPKEELFQNFLCDYFKKKGLSNTAKIFKNEARVSGHILPEFDKQPHGLLCDFWNLNYGTSSESQAPKVGATMDNTPQIIRDKYSIQHHASFLSNQKLMSCDFSSDGKIIASGGIGASDENGAKPFICYVESRASVTALESDLDIILEVRFQPKSTRFATTSRDGTVKLWDAKKPERALFNYVVHNGKVRSLDFHPTEEIICSSDSNVIKVWDLKQHATIKELQAGGSLVRFQPGSGRHLAVANQNVITIHDLKDPNVRINLQGHTKDIYSMCWDVTGKMIASVTEDDVRVWSVFMVKQCMYKYPSNGNRFQSVIFHPRYPGVLVIGGFQCLEWLIIENGQRFNKGSASDISITGLAASTAQSEFHIASASTDSMVKLWK